VTQRYLGLFIIFLCAACATQSPREKVVENSKWENINSSENGRWPAGDQLSGQIHEVVVKFSQRPMTPSKTSAESVADYRSTDKVCEVLNFCEAKTANKAQKATSLAVTREFVKDLQMRVGNGKAIPVLDRRNIQDKLRKDMTFEQLSEVIASSPRE